MPDGNSVILPDDSDPLPDDSERVESPDALYRQQIEIALDTVIAKIRLRCLTTREAVNASMEGLSPFPVGKDGEITRAVRRKLDRIKETLPILDKLANQTQISFAAFALATEWLDIKNSSTHGVDVRELSHTYNRFMEKLSSRGIDPASIGIDDASHNQLIRARYLSEAKMVLAAIRRGEKAIRKDPKADVLQKKQQRRHRRLADFIPVLTGIGGGGITAAELGMSAEEQQSMEMYKRS